MRRAALGVAVLLAAGVGVFFGPRLRDTTSPRRGGPGGRPAPKEPRPQGRAEQPLLAAPEPGRVTGDPEDRVAPATEMGSVTDLLLVDASILRDTYEVGEAVRIHRVFENPTERPISIGPEGWRQRVHGEVVLAHARGSRLYEPATAQLSEAVVAPHGRTENDIEVELPGAGDWTIEIPPAYQARSPQRRCFRWNVTVLDRGDPGHLAGKAERLARTIQTEDPECPTCWSEAQKDLETLGVAAVPHLRRWLAGATSAHLRAVSAKILGPMAARGAEGREELLAALADPDPNVRKMCVEAVATPATAETLDALLPMIRDADPWVRIEAIQAVATSDDVRVVPALVAALGDADSYVRQWAATELAEKGNPQGARVLVEALTADPVLNATLVVGALEKLTGLSFGKAEMPFVHSFEEQVDEAIAANRKLARRWQDWWETEGARRYGD